MLAVGLDLVNMEDMADTLSRSGESFLKRVFSQRELELAEICSNPVAFYAGAFAAKEALFKALVLNWADGIDLFEIEVLRGERGEPVLELTGKIRAIAESRGPYEISLSISYDRLIAGACVVCQAERRI
jgi:holo-[acyl-carrier protein] synthase